MPLQTRAYLLSIIIQKYIKLKHSLAMWRAMYNRHDELKNTFPERKTDASSRYLELAPFVLILHRFTNRIFAVLVRIVKRFHDGLFILNQLASVSWSRSTVSFKYIPNVLNSVLAISYSADKRSNRASNQHCCQQSIPIELFAKRWNYFRQKGMACQTHRGSKD